MREWSIPDLDCGWSSMRSVRGAPGGATMTQDNDAATIPAEVSQFIAEHITSIEQLEVLLFLHGRTDKARSAAEIATELYIHPESTASRLADLELRGLVARDQDGSSAYRYSAR